MAKFLLVADQTTLLGERRLTWRCTSCGSEQVVKEFPHKQVSAVKEEPCPVCEKGLSAPEVTH